MLSEGIIQWVSYSRINPAAPTIVGGDDLQLIRIETCHEGSSYTYLLGKQHKRGIGRILSGSKPLGSETSKRA